MGKITTASYLCGVKHWVIYTKRQRIVLRYFGHSDDYYWFTDVQTRAHCSFTATHLARMVMNQELRCFCFNFAQLDQVQDGSLHPTLRKALERLCDEPTI